jgi:predicted transposase YbfD/YdcC
MTRPDRRARPFTILNPAAAHAAAVAALAPDQCRSLLCDLAQITDPRQRRGRRHALVGVLGIAVCAVLAGARSLAAIGEWAADAPGQVLAALGVRRDPWTGAFRPPAEATVRRVLARVDPDALDLVIGAWLAHHQPAPRRPPRAVAVDGKTLRGSGHHAAPVHLLAAMDHTTAAVLAQTDVDAATNEITRLRPLLERLDLAGQVVTADALHTQREHADWLVVHKHAAYLLIVKANQPTLHHQLTLLPWRDIPVADHTGDRGHGRVETRRLQVTTVAGLDFPTPPRRCASPAGSGPCTAGAGGPWWCTRSPASPPPRPAPPAWPTTSGGSGASRRCTTSAMSPSPRTPARSAPAPHPGPWPACATSPSASCATAATATSPPACAATPATPPASCPCLASQAHDPDTPAKSPRPWAGVSWSMASQKRRWSNAAVGS